MSSTSCVGETWALTSTLSAFSFFNLPATLMVTLPWDAFLASAILLRDNGAAQVGGEWAAAMRYFSGGTNPAYSFYGDNVLAIAEGYEQDIVDLDF